MRGTCIAYSLRSYHARRVAHVSFCTCLAAAALEASLSPRLGHGSFASILCFASIWSPRLRCQGLQIDAKHKINAKLPCPRRSDSNTIRVAVATREQNACERLLLRKSIPRMHQSQVICFRHVKFDLIWIDLSWFELIWIDLSWFVLIWFDLNWFELIWFDLVWFKLIWFDLD